MLCRLSFVDRLASIRWLGGWVAGVAPVLRQFVTGYARLGCVDGFPQVDHKDIVTGLLECTFDTCCFLFVNEVSD